MADFSSKVTIARPKSQSLRTTIPEAVAKLMELKAGSELIWTVRAIKGAVDVSVSKV